MEGKLEAEHCYECNTVFRTGVQYEYSRSSNHLFYEDGIVSRVISVRLFTYLVTIVFEMVSNVRFLVRAFLKRLRLVDAVDD